MILLACASPVVAGGVPLRGTVVDQTGAPVSGALVVAVSSAWRVENRSNDAGVFAIDLPQPADIRVTAAAPGFGRAEQVVGRADIGRACRLVLPVRSLAEQITVTSTRAEVRAGEAPASVTVVPREVLDSAGSPALDDVLRQVPGFTLFRRSGSRTANPTSQGVSLRGLGASGASRALVLDDGVPLNDAFGGWVYWDRVPPALLDHVEVMQGGASDLYGSGALGGVVNLIRRTVPARRVFDADLSAGSLATRQLSLTAGGRAGRWSVLAGSEASTTAGYVPAAPAERGPVDIAAGSRHAAFDASIAHPTLLDGSAFVRASVLAETRGNGTPLQQNDTRLGQLAGGGQWALIGGGLQVRAFATDESFNQSFSAVSADRRAERSTGAQHVPAWMAGSNVQWSRAAGRHLVVAGLDVRQVTGSTVESTPGTTASAFAERRGRQEAAAVYAGDTIVATASLSLTAGARADHWRNDDGRQATWTSAKPSRVTTQLPTRSDEAFSPRVSAVYRFERDVIVTASAYRAFRAPTLNELYRSFRVGNVITQASADLRAERVTGTEGGFRFSPAGSRFRASARFFWMDMTNPVANVTIGSVEGTILRQRRNLGSIRSAGAELEAEVSLRHDVLVHAAYLFDRATVTAFPADPRLVGRLVPEQPRLGGSFRVQAVEPFGTFAVQARWAGAQYDDDLNQFALAAYGTIDAFASRRVSRIAQVFVAGENLANSQYEIAMTPVAMIGWPRSVRIGIRITR
jgi:outer membrane receptor protein involved in Fe transport